MGPEHFWWGGMWVFPMVMPIITLIVLIAALYLIFGRGRVRPPWQDSSSHPYENRQSSETALEILKKRYAKGEISKEEFEQMKKDILT
jgi:putative membrane protein